MNWLWIGVLLVVGGGAMQGSFTLPQKYMRGWAWEKGWLYYSIAGMIVFPWLIIATTIPHAMQAYANAGFAVVGLAALFGAGWGVGSVLFGRAVDQVGMSLAFAIIISLTAAVGSLVPLVVLHPDQAVSKRGAILLLGLAIVILGVTLCAKAGSLKDAATADKGSAAAGKFWRGLLLCVASGVMSPMMNFSLAFGSPIANQAIRLGAKPATASLAILTVAISSGFLINAGYCLYLLNANSSWKNTGNSLAGRNALYAIIMGFLWLFGMFFYGLGATQMGQLGPVLGWPVFMTVIVLVANFWGIATGEWKHADPRAYRFLKFGNAAMILAIAVIAWGTQA